MTNKTSRSRNDAAGAADEIDALYLELLHSFYEEGNREKARAVAERLEPALAGRPDFAGSIRAEEIGSLLAELRGDLGAAIRLRESEIDKIRRLHGLVKDKPGRDYVFRQYDYGDLSDRLDILATLYAERGDLGRAVELLHESKQFCERHQIPFDGQDLLDEYDERRGE